MEREWMDFKALSNLLGLTLSSAPYRLVVHARAIGYEARAHLECAGASLTDERRDSRREPKHRSHQRMLSNAMLTKGAQTPRTSIKELARQRRKEGVKPA
jgi:hypothetical protein